MKAFILAAGHGTRLRFLTEHTPKCLLPIQGVPLLEIWLEQCRQAGITDVLVNAHAHADQVVEFAKKRSGVRVHVSEEKELLGSAGTLAENRQFVDEEKEFFIVYGDVLTNVDLLELLKFHRERKPAAATLGVYEVTDPARCGVVELDQQGTVRSFVEKPQEPRSNLAFTGIMVAGQEIFDQVPAERPADIGFDLLPKLVGRMAATKICGYLRDIGTIENYRTAQEDWPGLRRTASC